MFRLSRFFVLLAIISLYSISKAEELSFSRVNYGYANLPIWSPITPFEEKTILETIDGTNDLLPLYLLASGEVRTFDHFQQYNHRFETWLSSFKSKIKRKNEIQKGALLFTAMHEEFFPENEFSGYEANQSQLNRIFDYESYNCISSAMLYIAAAKKLDLDVKGVLIPSHAFVQLTLANQTIIEIETTSKSGFNIQHDDKFFQSQADEWATAREIALPTFNDYQNREVISPVELGLVDMWSQHVGVDRMSHQDRFRLTEIKSHLSPMDVDTQKNRLAFYLSEFTYLNREKEHTHLKSMFRVISPYLIEVHNNHPTDFEVTTLHRKIRATFALTLMETSNFDEGYALVKEVMVNPYNYAGLDEESENILYYALDKYIQQLVKENNFEEASLVLENTGNNCLSHAICSTSLRHVYLSWAGQHWEIRNWKQILHILYNFPGINDQKDENSPLRSNLVKAYVNWSDELVWDGDWEIAVAKLEECLEKISEAALCSLALEKITAKRNAGYL